MNLNNLKVRADFKGFRGQTLSCKAQVVQKQQQPDIWDKIDIQIGDKKTTTDIQIESFWNNE